jgi:hypothetical protein
MPAVFTHLQDGTGRVSTGDDGEVVGGCVVSVGELDAGVFQGIWDDVKAPRQSKHTGSTGPAEEDWLALWRVRNGLVRDARTAILRKQIETVLTWIRAAGVPTMSWAEATAAEARATREMIDFENILVMMDGMFVEECV